MRFHVKFGSSASKGVRINKTEIQILRCAWAPPPCGRGALSPYKYAPPLMCYADEFGRSRSNGTSVIIEIRLKKNDPSRPAFQGHSRSSESTLIVPPPCDFLLKFRSNNGPISYRFRDKRRFHSTIANFPHLRVFSASAEGVPLELCIGAPGRKKLE